MTIRWQEALSSTSNKHYLFCLPYKLFRWRYFIQHQLVCSLCRNLIVD